MVATQSRLPQTPAQTSSFFIFFSPSRTTQLGQHLIGSTFQPTCPGLKGLNSSFCRRHRRKVTHTHIHKIQEEFPNTLLNGPEGARSGQGGGIKSGHGVCFRSINGSQFFFNFLMNYGSYGILEFIEAL